MKILVSKLLLIALFATAFSGGLARAQVQQGQIPYYGASFYQDLQAGVSDRELVQRLNVILKSMHTVQENSFDLISPTCQGEKCYGHKTLGYNLARDYMMGEFYLIKTDSGYGERDVYCDHNKSPEDFTHGKAPRPNGIPDGNIINTEHTWPQSRFSRDPQYPAEMQKSDLHHMFPTDNQMNAIRGNYTFGEVEADARVLKCSNVHFGKSKLGNEMVFTPPPEHKGNVARAIFYFSTRYELAIDPHEEAVLRTWNQQDPVDEEERRLNNRIYELQGDRNPFIDYPELVNRIGDF